MRKTKYKMLALALTFSTGISAMTAGSAFAAPDGEEADSSSATVATQEENAGSSRRLPSPEEVEAMAEGKSPEQLEALRKEMESRGERKPVQSDESDSPYADNSRISQGPREDGPTVTPIFQIEIPVEMMTIKPEGYDPAAAKDAQAAEKAAAPAGETAQGQQAEEPKATAEKPQEAEPVKEESVAEGETASSEPQKEETKEERKAREKAEKKALKEAQKAEKEALKAAKKAEKEAQKALKKAAKEAEKAKKEGRELPAAEEKTATESKSAEAPAPVVDKALSDWTLYRPSEEMISATNEKLTGQTIADIVIVGAGSETISQAKLAVISRPGDKFAPIVIDKDREAIYDTGYFYDLYPTFQLIPEGVVITYHVMENPVLTSVDIKGNTVIPTEELMKYISVRPGVVLNTKELHENIRSIEDKYHEDGYVLVKLSGIDVGRDGKLNLAINEGILEGYSVKGNTKTKDKVVIREMRQKVGTPFNAKQARRGMQRVYNLGYFEDVNMKLNPGVEPNAVILEIDVVEKNTGSFTIGAGYSSRDGFLGMIGFGDKNFRGTGESFHISYDFGGDDWDAHGIQFSYHRPWMDKRETAMGIKLYNRTYEFDDYDTHGNNVENYMRKQRGYELSFSRPQTEYTTNFIMLRDRDDRYRRHKDGTDRSTPAYSQWRDDNFGKTRSLILNHVTDTRDNIYNPTEGGKVDLMVEWAGLGAKFKYKKYSIEQTHFNKVGHAQVFAWRWAYGRGHGHIPEIGQYRLGGQDTIRGYRDDIFRGNNMFLASLEYRFPVVRKVQGAIFFDSGAAWFGGWNPKGTHCSVGVGASIETPIGPIRIDVGHGSNGNRVHFSVGGAF